jgi:hypothetical protein
VTDDLKRQIHRMAGEGLSLRAIGRAVGLSHVTVREVLKNAAPPVLRALPSHMAPPDAPGPDADDPGDNEPALTQARFLLAQARADLRRAQAVGDSQLAQRCTRNCTALMTVLARLEREQDAAGQIIISEADLAAAEADLNAKARAFADRGGALLCSKCSRELSINWALGPATEAEAEAEDHRPG